MQLQQTILEEKNPDEKLIQLILELKKQLNAVILVHNYQRPEMYKIADFIGDSLGLSEEAAKTDADIILFCGVKFMAETAKILSPKKTVLLPSLDAGCALADMATLEQLKKVKEKHPDAAVVSYVNANADIKAESDVCCTSMNAVKIVNSLPNKEIIFLPDKNLGRHVASKTDKKIILWDGYCFVHDKLNAEMLDDLKKDMPGAKIIAHPECKTDILQEADHISGTGGMAKFANSSNAKDFIVVTECGMTEKLKEDVPDKNFYSFCNICPYMKYTTLPLVVSSLTQKQHEITLPEETIKKARKALDKMLEYS
ncbi:MAG: quinolinate synthase NadA [Candidatus Woesearchaeota archaeon]|jgi:quinolinate synthase|nr:quinolinate synthase NadA [Candidatus Woesearchaeota archaeon]MDP7622670.1 quinolinate synthase NadA [Candidatus Woesearchaeota archaeon]HJN57239.1 quinolinate synthase NadA [Candidatus Woesearchaeota archaeon]|tara:strand:+ start:4355 stop:5290 length:936 start_codon:yes stop_codon:yes gene_type:complete